MRHVFTAALVLLALAGCAAGGSGPSPRSAARNPAHPEQMSPAHPYCMFVPEAGELRACQQFAFGRCTAWSSWCPTPGWIEPARDRGTGGGTTSR